MIQMCVRQNERIQARNAFKRRQAQPAVAGSVEAAIDEKPSSPKSVVVGVRRDLPRSAKTLKTDADGVVAFGLDRMRSLGISNLDGHKRPSAFLADREKVAGLRRT